MKVDLNKLISIHIGGEISKHHSLPIDDFIKISEKLQELILSLAKHNLSNELTIDLNNFKIEICGFKEGSVIPQYRFTDSVHYLNGADVIQQRKKVSESFEQVLQISDSGDYSQLKTIYPAPETRNDVVEKIYEYTNAFGSAPAQIVNVSKSGKVVKLYKNNKLKTEAKKALLATIVSSEPDEVVHENAVGKIKITRSKAGVKKKISEVYPEKDATLSYKTDKIIVGRKVYTLHHPIMSNIEHENNYYIITSELLGITGTGETEADAKTSFAEEFDFIYNRYNQLKAHEHSDRIARIKTIMNAIVAKVEGE